VNGNEPPGLNGAGLFRRYGYQATTMFGLREFSTYNAGASPAWRRAGAPSSPLLGPGLGLPLPRWLATLPPEPSNVAVLIRPPTAVPGRRP
jgi:hypothetical protein